MLPRRYFIHVICAVFCVIIAAGCGDSGGSSFNPFKKKKFSIKSGRQRLEKLLEEDKPMFSKATPANDDKFIEGSLDQQLKFLQTQLSKESQKSHECREQSTELSQRANEYSERVDITRQRIAKLKRVMKALNGEDDGILSTSAPRESAFEPALSAGQMPELDSETTSLNSAPINDVDLEMPMFSDDISSGWTDETGKVAAPPGETFAPALNAFTPAKKAKNPINTATILSCDGEGDAAIAMLDKGSDVGIKKGDCYKVMGNNGLTTTLVVTDVFATYSRAVPHPDDSGYKFKEHDSGKYIDPNTP